MSRVDGFARSLAVRRCRALRERRSELVQALEPVLDVGAAGFVSAYLEGLEAPDPTALAPVWRAALVDRSLLVGQAADAFAVVAAAAGRLPAHGRWLFAHLRTSAALVRQREQARAMEATLDYLIGGVGRVLPTLGDDARSALREVFGEWGELATTHTGTELVEHTVMAFFDRVVAPVDIDEQSWRTLWSELDSLLAQRLGRWPHALALSLRVLMSATPRYRVLRRVAAALSDEPEVRRALVVGALLGEAGGLAKRRLLRSAPGSLGEADDVLALVREGIGASSHDLERHETDPVEDAAVRMHDQLVALDRSERFLGAESDALGSLASRLGEGLPASDAEELSQAIRVLAQQCILAVPAGSAGRRGLGARIVWMADGLPVLGSRARELGPGLARLLEPVDERAAVLARDAAEWMERLRRVPTHAGLALVDTIHRGRSDFSMAAFIELASGNTVHRRDAAAAAESLDELAFAIAGAEDVSQWVREIVAFADAAPEPVDAISESLKRSAGLVMAALEIGLSSSRLATLAADAHPAAMEVHDALVASYGRLFSEVAWALADRHSEPGQRVWDEWSPTVAHPLDVGWASSALDALDEVAGQVLSAGAAATVLRVIRGMFEDNLGLSGSGSTVRRTVLPEPFRGQGLRWARVFGPARSEVPGAGAFSAALERSCDPELAALKSGGRMERCADPLERAWQSAHAGVVQLGRGQTEVAALLLEESVRVARAVANAMRPFLDSEGDHAKCVRDQTLLVQFVAETLARAPFTASVLETVRFLTMGVGPFVSYDANQWRIAWSAMRAALHGGLSSDGVLCWTRLTDTLAAFSDGLATAGSLREVLHGEVARFSEDPDDERAWRELFASLVAAAFVGSTAPLTADALVQRLCLLEPMLADETPAGWSEKAPLLGDFAESCLHPEWLGAFIAVLDAVGVALHETERSDTPQPVTTSARVLYGAVGARGRWTADLILRQRNRRGIRDPNDLAVVRATGWTLPGPGELGEVTERLTALEGWTAPARVAPERGGLLGFFRSDIPLDEDVQSACTTFGREAVREDVLGLGRERRLASLGRLADASELGLGVLVRAVSRSVPGGLEDRVALVELIELARAIDAADDLAQTWVEAARVDSSRWEACVRDLDLLLQRVDLYARGLTPVAPDAWYGSHVRPFLTPQTRVLCGQIFGSMSLLTGSLGPSAATLGRLLGPLAAIGRVEVSA